MFFLLPILLGGLAGAVGGAVIGGIIDYLTQDDVEETVVQIPDSFKYMLHRAKQNAVDVGIFNKHSDHLETIHLEAKEVDSSLKFNKWYYIN